MSAALGWQTLLRSGPAYPHEEVEAAFQDYAARANMDDWEHWCDMFTDECLYVDHHFGVFRRRDDIARLDGAFDGHTAGASFHTRMACGPGESSCELQLESMAEPRRQYSPVL